MLLQAVALGLIPVTRGFPGWAGEAALLGVLGFAVGALVAGVVADLLGPKAAIWGVAGITAASGLVVAVRMYETHAPRRSLRLVGPRAGM